MQGSRMRRMNRSGSLCSRRATTRRLVSSSWSRVADVVWVAVPHEDLPASLGHGASVSERSNSPASASGSTGRGRVSKNAFQRRDAPAGSRPFLAACHNASRALRPSSARATGRLPAAGEDRRRRRSVRPETKPRHSPIPPASARQRSRSARRRAPPAAAPPPGAMRPSRTSGG